MSSSNNPHHEQMADESMLRTLSAQATAVWPQERKLIEGYRLPARAQILDLGCGPGEVSLRLLELLPDASLLGLDADATHLERARQRCRQYGERAKFVTGDALNLDLGERRFDLCVCRHFLHAVPRPAQVVENLVRLCKPGGRVHIVAEDYGMLTFHPVAEDIDAFWREGPARFGQATGTDLYSGRKIFTMLRQLGVADVRVDYVLVDTQRVARQTFADILTGWRDGFSSTIAEHTSLDHRRVLTCFDDMIRCTLDPVGYAAWQLPVVSALIE